MRSVRSDDLQSCGPWLKNLNFAVDVTDEMKNKKNGSVSITLVSRRRLRIFRSADLKVSNIKQQDTPLQITIICGSGSDGNNWQLASSPTRSQAPLLSTPTG
jgi:hypothetical protein